MPEAIDYNALSWIRKELGETLNQARLQLEEYAADTTNEALLQHCAVQLHEALGPLQMVDLKGAVLLTTEMEEVVADLLQGSIEQPETAMELLLQAFLQLPDYLSSIRSGRQDKPQLLLPLANSLRATRGQQPLQKTAIFSPNLSARVPASVFDIRADHSSEDVAGFARSARVRFQGGLLEWYRDSGSSTGLQALLEVLEQLQQSAASEPAARIWWVGAGVAEALRDGHLPASVETKQLFGQLDRQIKRLMDSGEEVFDDVLSDDLVKNLLFRIAQVTNESERIRLIRETYSIKYLPADCDETDSAIDELVVCSDEMMQTVAVTIRSDIDRMKELIDQFGSADNRDTRVIEPLVHDLHALANTLEMTGMSELSATVAEQVKIIQSIVAGEQSPDETAFTVLANTLVSVENAVGVADDDDESRVLRQGRDAVTQEIVASMGLAKEAISEFMKSADNYEPLSVVPGLMKQISGGLTLVNQQRAASAVSQVGLFIALELIERHQLLGEEQLDTLADAICSVEFYIEEIAENRSNTGRALDVAEQSMAKLGYACPVVDEEDDSSSTAGTQLPDVHDDVQEENAGWQGQAVSTNNVNALEPGKAGDSQDIAGMQVIAGDVDEEILEIFIEEADEELQKLSALVPTWVASSDDDEYLADIRRSFHTLKGSGRMVGALAVGEFAWALETLLNRIIDGTVKPHEGINSVISSSVAALGQLMSQVKGCATEQVIDVNDIARQALRYCNPAGAVLDTVQSADCPVDTGADVHVCDSGSIAMEEALPESKSLSDLPALSADADSEIVEIFLEEAAEEIENLVTAIPQCAGEHGQDEALVIVRRSLHTLKGSGRMAGAMIVGEFSWCMENLLNKILDGTVQGNDAVHSLLSDVPSALLQLIEQVRSGAVPKIDAGSMMQRADALCRGETPAIDASEEPVVYVESLDEFDDTCKETESPEPVAEAEGEVSLLDVFSRECDDILVSIEEFLAEGDAPRVASESLYRALHTLSGISESAEVISIRELTAVLNRYIDSYYHVQQPLSCEAIDVLRDCAMEVAAAVQRLPDLSYDLSHQQSLRDRIAALPCVDEPPAAEETAKITQDAVVTEAVPVQHASAPADESLDPFAEVDQEIFEIFVEESSEIIDSSEAVLRAWAEQPEDTENMVEFQRQLHTIKGGARMVDIPAIGDLSHTLESLLTRIADGVIATSGELFSLLHESHDRLSEMLEQVRLRQMPAPASRLQAHLDALCEGGSEPLVYDESAESAEVCDSHDEPPVEAIVHTDEVDVAAVEQAPLFTELSGEPVDQVSEPEDAGIEPSNTPADAASPATDAAETPVHESLSQPKKAVREKQAHVHGEQVRVQSDLLDDMVNYAGEINIYRSRMEQQVSDYRFNLAELDQTISRLRAQLRKMEMETETQILFRYEQETDSGSQEFDPLEMDRYSNLQQLSRSLMESISDLRSLQELMEHTTRESETLLLQQSRVSTDLQEGLMRTRMIPFSGLSSRLRRIVRQSARQLGKKVDLKLVGADGEMDRTVIDRVIAPLEHMLRNAVAHGIEKPEQRELADKAATGIITIIFDREGPEIVLRIEDDGAGLDIEAIRTRATERGLMTDDSSLTDNEIMQFILQTGFSTATEVTQISGRGVGMDVVNSEVKQLGGSLHIESTAGQGSVFTVRLPYTLAINQALLATAGEELFCVPLGSVEGVVRANCEELATCYRSDECIFEYAGNPYQLKHLGTLLKTGTVNLDTPDNQVPVLLVKVGEKRIALQVETLMGSREIVIKPVGAQLSTVDCISGATILGDGSVVMILDMAAVARMNANVQLTEAPLVQEDESRLVVMVVDDSITVRKVTTRLLERNGFKVLTAKDGVDAMGQLQETVPDMMLLDIEMPRMDGFELATHMRNDDRLKHVPIIMITSRTGSKHRERAQQIGVNNYLGKPYQENDLLDSIHRIIGVSTEGAVA